MDPPGKCHVITLHMARALPTPRHRRGVRRSGSGGGGRSARLAAVAAAAMAGRARSKLFQPQGEGDRRRYSAGGYRWSDAVQRQQQLADGAAVVAVAVAASRLCRFGRRADRTWGVPDVVVVMKRRQRALEQHRPQGHYGGDAPSAADPPHRRSVSNCHGGEDSGRAAALPPRRPAIVFRPVRPTADSHSPSPLCRPICQTSS